MFFRFCLFYPVEYRTGKQSLINQGITESSIYFVSDFKYLQNKSKKFSGFFLLIRYMIEQGNSGSQNAIRRITEVLPAGIINKGKT